jgi:hypothetical protein
MTPSDRDAVQFTRESAERIANVVRAAELTPTRGRALSFEAIQQSASRKTFRMATFTGAWAINDTKTVTLQGSTATLVAINRFFDHPDVGTRNCAVAKDGTAWNLIQWQWNYSVATVVTGASLGSNALTFSRASVVVLDQGTAATVSISITTCSTAAT